MSARLAPVVIKLTDVLTITVRTKGRCADGTTDERFADGSIWKPDHFGLQFASVSEAAVKPARRRGCLSSVYR